MGAVLALFCLHALRGVPWWEPVALAGWLVALTLAGQVQGRRRSTGVWWGTLIAVAIQAVLALPLLGDGRASAWSVHPNMAAPGLTIAAAILVVVSQGRSTARLLGLAGATMSLALALAAGSRGMWLGASFGVVAWALFPRAAVPSMAWRLIPAGFAVASGLWIAFVRRIAFDRLLVSDIDRGLVQGIGLRLAAERPVFGHGGVPWSQLAARIEPSVPTSVLVHAHSVPLHLLAHGGAFALVLMAWLLLGALPALRKGMMEIAAADPLAGLALCMVAGVLVVQSLLDLVLPAPGVFLGMWMLALVVLDRRRKGSEAGDG